MGFRAGLKNAGKWARINSFLADHPDFKATINANAGVQAVLVEMNTILHNEATSAGVADQFPETLQAKGLPVPLRVWQGRLVYSVRIGLSGSAKKKATPNQKAFRLKAKNLRDHVDTMFRAFSALDDALSEPTSKGPNPGGNIGDGGTP